MDRGWAWVVMVAGLLSMFTGGILVYSVGVLHVVLLREFREDNAKSAMVGSLHTSLQMIAGPMTGVLVARLGCRVSMCVGGVAVMLGCALSALAPDINTLLVTYGVIGGLGLSFVYLPSVVGVSYNFNRHRGLASAITVTGGGMGIFAGSPLIRRLLDTYGLRGTYLMLGAIAFHISLFGMLTRPSALERKLMRLAREGRRTEALMRGAPSMWRRLRDSMVSYLGLFKNRAFLSHSLSMLVWNMGYAAVVLHLPAYSEALGSSPAQAADLFTGLGISSIVARLLTGAALSSGSKHLDQDKAQKEGAEEDNIASKDLAQEEIKLEEEPQNGKAAMVSEKEKERQETRPDFDCLTMHISGLGLSGLATLLLPVYGHSYGGQMAFACIFGLYSGMPTALFAPLTVELVGVDRLASAFGLETLFMGIGYCLGPPIAGAIIDAGGTYAHTFIFSGAVTLLGSLLSLVTGMLRVKDAPPPCPLEVVADVRGLGSLRFLPAHGSLSFLSSTATLHFRPDSTNAGSMQLDGVDSTRFGSPLLSGMDGKTSMQCVQGEAVPGVMTLHGQTVLVTSVEELDVRTT